MPLTILSVAYPLAPVSPDAVGGAEQILAFLDRAIVDAGHRSLVIACERSRVAGRLIATPAVSGVLDEARRRQAQACHSRRIQETLAKYPVNCIHFHGVDFREYLPAQTPPAIVTLHLPPSWYPVDIFHEMRLRLVCVSHSQHRACPPGARIAAVIPNGVPLGFDRHPPAQRRYALALGRICPEKGFHLALDACARAGVQLLLAGKVYSYPEHQAYFEREILPRLDHLRRFIGPANAVQKRRLLVGARCLLAPSLVAETSSLVAMEALAAGTPVIAFRSGALPEIIEHGRTGFLVSSVAEMARAIHAIEHLDSEPCRRAARTRFAVEHLARQYLELYQSIAGEQLETPRDAA